MAAKTKALWVTLLAAAMALGFAMGYAAGQSEEKPETGKLSFQKDAYSCTSKIYINDSASDQPGFSHSDLVANQSLSETYITIFNTSAIRDAIAEEYPNAEYELSMVSVNDTNIYEITATSEDPNNLQEICDLAVNLFCEKLADITGGSAKIVDRTTPPQLSND